MASSGIARFDDLNLSATMPGGQWSKLDPKKTGSRACLLLGRQNPEIIISLAGERVGTEADNTNTTLLAESQTKMNSMPGAFLSSTTELSTHGIDGVFYEATIGADETKTHYSIWVAAHHGYNYKLAVYGNQNDRAAVNAAMRNFVRGIKHIEPTKVARTGGKPISADTKLAERNHNAARKTK